LTIPPSTPGRASRAALITRLTELRETAGLSGNALAKRMEVVQSRVWKIEHGTLMPNEDDITAWTEATGHPEAAGDLAEMLKAARGEQAFSTVYRQRGGAAAYEDRVRTTEERSARIGEFEVAVIPGLLQTADYCREVVSLPGGLRAWGMDDTGIAAKVNGRLRRQEILHDPARRIQMVLGEAALRTRVVPPAVLTGQLGKLLSLLRLPAVELGVIPFGRQVPAYTLGGFRVYDEDMITVESIAGERDFTADQEPEAVAAFLEAFEALRQAASTGVEAESLIQQALDGLREGE
jgi:transcriptional regulator with XRE-family HTH domain